MPRKRKKVRVSNLSPAQKAAAKRKLDILHGKGAGGKSNHGYNDPYYERSIEDEFNMTISALKEEIGYDAS